MDLFFVTVPVKLRHNQQMRETDDIIIGRVLSGESNAYALLVDRYKDRVYSLVYGIMRDEEKAKELAQDAFVKAYTNLKKFRKEASFSTWIYRIAYNAAVSETRKSKRKMLSFDEQMEYAASASKADEIESEEEDGVKKALLHSVLNSLPAEERLIIMLYYFEDQSIDQISRSSGLSQSNVKVKLFRVRKKLKEIIVNMGITELAVY